MELKDAATFQASISLGLNTALNYSFGIDNNKHTIWLFSLQSPKLEYILLLMVLREIKKKKKKLNMKTKSVFSKFHKQIPEKKYQIYLQKQ